MEDLILFPNQGERQILFRTLLQHANKLSFDSLIVNITELHINVRIDTEQQSELFDFSLTDDVQYELEWTYFPTFRPHYKVADNVLANFTAKLLELMEECCNHVETIHFGSCRFLDVSMIFKAFLLKETVNRIHIQEWSGFCSSMTELEPVWKMLKRMQHLEISASDSRNTQRRQSVQTLIKLALKTGNLLTLKCSGADYTVPALAPLLATNKQLVNLELQRFKILLTTSTWQETFRVIRNLTQLRHLVLGDISIHETMVVPMYRSLLENNNTLRKLTVRTVCGHPSFVNATSSHALRQIFSSATCLEEVRFESSVIHRTEVNTGLYLGGLLESKSLSSLEISPCVIDAASLVMALSRKGSKLRVLRIGSLHRDIDMLDLELIAKTLVMNPVVEDLSLAMATLSLSSARLLGSCLANQTSLRHVSITISSHTNDDEDLVRACEALAYGIEHNTGLQRFDLICRLGFRRDTDLMAPFSAALLVNTTIQYINLANRPNCLGLKMDPMGAILLEMNRLGRRQWLDPGFPVNLWPLVLAKITNPNVSFLVLKAAPTLALRSK